MKALLELSISSAMMLPRRVIIQVSDETMEKFLSLKGKRVSKVEKGVAHIEEILNVRLCADKIASDDWGRCPKFKSFSHFLDKNYIQLYEPDKR